MVVRLLLQFGLEIGKYYDLDALNLVSFMLLILSWAKVGKKMPIIQFSYDAILTEVLSRLDLPPQMHECRFDTDTGVYLSNMTHAYKDSLGVSHTHVLLGSSPYSIDAAKSDAGLKGIQFLKSVYGFDIGDFNLIEVTDLRIRLQNYTCFEMAGADAFAELKRNYEDLGLKYAKAMQVIMATSEIFKLFNFGEHMGGF